MDPLSIAASACGIAALCGTIISTVGTFITDVKSLPQTLDEFNTSITTLRTVLNNIDSVVSRRPKHLLFAQKQEHKHWQDVKNVLEACNGCLYKLRNEIPQLATDKNRPLQQACMQLELTLKSNVVMQIRGHISSYTQILQLSLTTMSLGSVWETQKSQDLIRSKIQKLTSEIRASNVIIQRRRVKAESSPCDDLTLEEMLATRNIEAWRESAESLAAAITLYEPDQQSLADRAEDGSFGDEVDFAKKDEIPDKEPTLSINGREAYTSLPDSGVEVDETVSDWDPEPENTYCLSVDIIKCQVAANQENVTRLLNGGLYFQAEQYQRKGIELQDQLLRTHKIPFPDRADAEETLADILRRQGARDALRRAKDILQRLVQQEVQGDHSIEEDRSRCWRLYHKLGEIYLELGVFAKAKAFSHRALEGRKKLVPAQNDLVLETANLLANAFQMNQDFDEASGLRTWISQQGAGSGAKIRTDSLPPNPAMADVLRWCKERGFDVDSPGFRFEKPNANGKTPLHIAVSEEKLDIVEEIVNHVQTLETRDNDSASALLLACSTRNRHTTEALLKRAAKVNVHDMYLNTPLHRVHSATGGIAVARLLLDYPGHPINIDEKNIYDKTALHLACEMGNEPMVDLLLDHGADPNCHGPANCTPLHVAIYSRRISIVKKLLDRGADTALRDNTGLDAVTAAKTTKLASKDIIKLILEHEHEHRTGVHQRSQVRSLDLAGGGPTKSSMASDHLNRTETRRDLKASTLSNPPRRETVYSQYLIRSGISKWTEGQESTSTSETSITKSLKLLKLGLRRHDKVKSKVEAGSGLDESSTNCSKALVKEENGTYLRSVGNRKHSSLDPNEGGLGTQPRLEYEPMSHIRDTVQEHLLLGSEYVTEFQPFSNTPLTYKATFAVTWPLQEFMRTQYGDPTSTPLGSVITISGTGQCAQAATCRDYLAQTWPLTASLLLHTIQTAIEDGQSEGQVGTLVLNIAVQNSGVSCLVQGTIKEVIEVGQQLAWLGAAFQQSPTGNLAYSRTTIHSGLVDPAVFNIEFAVEPLETGEKTCWYSLFSNAIIAKGFPIPKRGQEIGLEIPLPMMASLIGARHAVEFEGGLLVKGHSSMFVPIKRYKDSIQWHYLEDINDDRLPYSAVESRCPGRAMLGEVNYSCLRDSRAFVGWWAETETHLGTAHTNYENIDWSASKMVERQPKVTGATLGFQQIITGELNFALGPKDGKLHIERKGPYRTIVRCAAKTPVVLYDFEEKRAWLVPASAVILHVAKTRHFHEPYLDNGKSIDLPSADPTTSNHGSAEKTLLQSAAVKISCEDGSGTEDYYLRDLVRDIWSLLESLLDKNIKKETSSDIGIRCSTRHILRGWEYMDLVGGTSVFNEKQIFILRSSGGWTGFARDIDAIVLFASGFEDIIRPADSAITGLCHKWKQVPKDKDYMAVSIPMLVQLFERAGSRLTRKHLTSTHLQWHCGSKLWENCKNSHSFNCDCCRLQQLVQESVVAFGAVSPPGLLEDNGAVIFGQGSHLFNTSKPERRPPEIREMYSQPNEPLIIMDSFNLSDPSSSGDSSLISTSSVSTLPTSEEGETD